MVRGMVDIPREAIRPEFEVFQTQGCEDGNNDRVMGHVHVERLVEGKLGLVVGEGGVDAGVAGGNEFVLQSSGEFKHPADPLGAAGGGAVGVVAVELDVEVVCVVFPFLFREERAEEGSSKGGVFVDTQVLHCEDVVGCEVEVVGEVLRETSNGAFGVFVDEDFSFIVPVN